MLGSERSLAQQNHSTASFPEALHSLKCTSTVHGGDCEGITWCYDKRMALEAERIFKTAWFAKAAKKARIPDEELCEAVRQVVLGQVDDLGGGVFKKRLGRNLYRSLILAKGRRQWVYVYLFAKKDRANIEQDELASFRALAVLYSRKTEEEFAKEMQLKELVEICR